MTFDLTYAKSIFQSTTFWGAVISLFSQFTPHIFANIFGGAQQTTIVAGILTGIGFLVTVYGRLTAKVPVTVMGRLGRRAS